MALTELLTATPALVKNDSPFVSVTTDPRYAQLMAQRKDETIYELELAAHQLIGDPDRLGAPSRPQGTELFVVGLLEPSSIVAIKKNNQDRQASELIHDDGRYEHTFFSWMGDNSPIPTELNPLGAWDTSGNWIDFASHSSANDLALATR